MLNECPSLKELSLSCFNYDIIRNYVKSNSYDIKLNII